MQKMYVIFFICFSCLNFSAQQQEHLSPLRSSGLNFAPNKGQIIDMNNQPRPDILYVGDGGGAQVYLRKNTVSYVFTQTEPVKADHKNELQAILPNTNSNQIKIHRIDMEFTGGNPNALTTSEDQTEGFINYYLPQCPDGITNVTSYNKVTYHELYKNTDVIFYGEKAKGLKYDIIVKPGGNPNDVKLKYSGQEKLEIKNNRLYLTTAFGEIEEYLPKVYQNINGKIIDIKTEYILTPSPKGEDWGEVSFKLSTFNSLFPLVIDPFTTWITYYGGSGSDQGNGITTDAAGNIFVIGSTTSTNFPVLAGFQMAKSGGSDVLVVKFDAAGVRLWATYYGGSGVDYGYGITTDGTGNVFIIGETQSANFPVLLGFQMTYAGSTDAFAVKLNNTGTPLWATYYGGSMGDYGHGIATDALGNIFITGNTESTNLPVLLGFQMTNITGFNDVFVVKFNNAGTMLWATYYGGSLNDYGQGITTDAFGNVIFTGYTYSNDFPVLSGFQMTYAGAYDGFVVKMDGAGSQLWATYYGGGQDEYIYGIATDAGGNIFVSGYTNSNNFPVVAGFQMTLTGNTDAFVVKLDAAGSQLWATYYGGTLREEGSGIAVDQVTGNSYITGDTYSTDFPVTTSACLSSAQGGVEDNYMASFDPDGVRLCGTYIGGSDHDEEGLGSNVAVSGCYVYITGYTPGNYPVTATAFQKTYGGGVNDVFIAQLPKDCSCSVSTPVIMGTSTPTSCAGNDGTATVTVTVTGGNLPYTYSWNPTGQTGQTATGLSAGTYTVTASTAASCTGGINSQTLTVTVGSINGAIVALSTSANILCNGGNTNVTAIITGGTSPYTYLWSSGASSITSATSKIELLTSNTYTVTITDMTGCAGITTITITQPSPLSLSLVPMDATCGNNNGQITATPAGGNGTYTYLWSTNGTGSQISNLTSQIYSVTITDSKGCTTTSTSTINDTPLPIAVASATATNITSGNSTTLNASGGTTYLWTPPNFLNFPNIQNPIATPPITTTYTLIVTDANNCKDTTEITIDVTELKECTNDPYLPIAFSPNNDGQNDVLYLRGSTITNIELIIFNRWGNKVFETNNPTVGWDGNCLGEICDSGVYVYYLKAECLKDKSKIDVKGNVTLIR